ncbi:unnamed protein product [Effrenium voratum]|nr:unnamed protein product [Effrenium voratum]
MDLNHRPALGSWKELWNMAEPHLGTLDVLVFSIGDVIQVGEIFGEDFAADFKALKRGRAGAESLDALVRKCIAKLQLYLGNRTNIAVTCKARDVSDGLPQQLRWSVVCLKAGTVLSSYAARVPQEVREEVARPWRFRIIEKKDEEDSAPPDPKGALRGLKSKEDPVPKKKKAASESFVYWRNCSLG